jgi:hypothetical protein
MADALGIDEAGQDLYKPGEEDEEPDEDYQ